MQASKRLRNTPRKTSAKKLKPVHPRSQDMLLRKAEAVPIEGRPRWVPPVEDDYDYEVPYCDLAVDPLPSTGLVASGPPTHPTRCKGGV